MSEKLHFTERKMYPVIFIILITTFFVGILAFFYHSTKDRVDLYAQNKFQETILNLFDLPADNINDSFKEHIKVLRSHINNDSLNYYQAIHNNNTIGYAFIINGNGLWGKIQACVALSPDLNNLISFNIISQNETPGLGARITEDWFLKQFSNIPLFINNEPQRLILIDENETPENNYEIRRVTGATSSTGAVVNMILQEVQTIKNNIQVEL